MTHTSLTWNECKHGEVKLLVKHNESVISGKVLSKIAGYHPYIRVSYQNEGKKQFRKIPYSVEDEMFVGILIPVKIEKQD